jgi:hypothetical protein
MTRSLDPHDPVWFICSEGEWDCEGELDANGVCLRCGAEHETFEDAQAAAMDEAYERMRDRELFEAEQERADA